jgi:hypothetical protein
MEAEHHICATRFRLTGSGDLKLTLLSLDGVNTQDLVDLTMASLNSIEPTRLANFQSQRIQLNFRTTAIDEIFEISKIILYAKPVAVEYPG